MLARKPGELKKGAATVVISTMVLSAGRTSESSGEILKFISEEAHH